MRNAIHKAPPWSYVAHNLITNSRPTLLSHGPPQIKCIVSETKKKYNLTTDSRNRCVVSGGTLNEEEDENSRYFTIQDIEVFSVLNVI